MEYIRNDNVKIEFTTILENAKKATSFKHFKGNIYKIVCLAKDSEDLNDYVIYQGQYENKPIWTRKATDFFSEVDRKKYPDVKAKYRFEKID